MDNENRDDDKKVKLIPMKETGMARREVSLDTVKSAYIGEGLSAKEIAERYFLTLDRVNKLIEDHRLPELRRAYIREGVAKIQNIQLSQAQKLMDIELNFKRLRIVQLEKMLEDFMAYYARHSDLYKRHPVSGEILKDADDIPMQLRVPNVSKEISELKESVTLSEGLKKLLVDIDGILNTKSGNETVNSDDGIIDIDNYEEIFKKNP